MKTTPKRPAAAGVAAAVLSTALAVLLIIGLSGSCAKKAAAPLPPEIGAASRTEAGGWIKVHLEGTPREIGFQHGWLLAPEIDETLRVLAHFLQGSTKRDWAFFREAAGRMFWPRLEPEYRDEIQAIADGVRARLPKSKWDRIDITALNGWIELAWYYVPSLEDRARPGAGNNKAPGYCSAFVATGSYTADGKVLIGHNNWVDYIVGEHWNVVADIVPAQGHRILMDCLPGAIHSGDDFAVNGAGIVYTETTISQFKGFREDGTPEFMRARKAAQYASSIDDFVRIMSAGNNGAYANDWLIGDTKANEIARFELGLKNQRLWRTRDGYYVGSNWAADEKLIAEETTFNPKDASLSVLARKARWEGLMAEFKGEMDVEDAKLFEGDHVDAGKNASAVNGRTLCGHIDEDPAGTPEMNWGPFSPAGSVQGKVTSAALVAEMKFWGRLGHPCGRNFVAAAFLEKHPEFRWQLPYLKDMKSGPWTLLAKRD